MTSSRLLPQGEFPPGLDRGDYVALTFEEMRDAYNTFSAGLNGELEQDPAFPATYKDAETGLEVPLADTPANRARFAAAKLFDDDAKRISFMARINKVMSIALGPKYAKYVDDDRGAFHAAILIAAGGVRFSVRTNPKALRAAFDRGFRLALQRFAPGPDKIQ